MLGTPPAFILSQDQTLLLKFDPDSVIADLIRFLPFGCLVAFLDLCNSSRICTGRAAVSAPAGVSPELSPAVLFQGIFRVGMHHLIVKVRTPS